MSVSFLLVRSTKHSKVRGCLLKKISACSAGPSQHGAAPAAVLSLRNAAGVPSAPGGGAEFF